MEVRPQHVPVLLKEVTEFVDVRPGGIYIDATLGFAGHSSEIVRRLGPQGRLIAFDRDPAAMERATARLEQVRQELGDASPQIELHSTEFSSANELIAAGSIDGVLADFGVSSMQLDEGQ